MAIVIIALKILHLSASVMFLGDIIVGALWKWFADKTKSTPVIAYAQRQLIWMDKWVLIPSIVVLLASGYIGGQLQSIPMWSSLPYAGAQMCFFFSGVVWRGVLRPVQARQLALVDKLEPSATVPDEYYVLAQKWLRFGLLAIALPVAALVLMILR